MRVAIACFCAAAIIFAGGETRAQGALSRSYIDPFPEGDLYRMVVLGSSLAEGLWSGLARAFEKDRNIETVRKTRGGSGLARPSRFDWDKALQDILVEQKYHIAVVMLGVNDLRPIRTEDGVAEFGSERWRDLYGDRVERFVRRLKEENIAVYWVGLPIMRSPKTNEQMQVLNEVFRQRAFVNGVKFIDTWNGFADQFGRYSPFGPDMSGQVRRLRADDGVHFTMTGYEKLAHFVEREIRRDLNFAKGERNIPLAGDPEEQSRALDRLAARAEPGENRLGRRSNATANSEKPVSEHTKKVETPKPVVKESRVAGVAIFRPALPEAALNAAHSLTPTNLAGSLPEGETIASEIEGGLTALATISPVNETASFVSRTRQPLTERPYYRVLIKGEQLEPKEGRADDFAWRKDRSASSQEATAQ